MLSDSSGVPVIRILVLDFARFVMAVAFPKAEKVWKILLLDGDSDNLFVGSEKSAWNRSSENLE